ncbi:MAG TPA: GNAT family N-acetyltransferase [Rectinemataceae bacterium]|nr:GNAT family N-acetyltransferase [Rectinemataceae bacterium]
MADYEISFAPRMSEIEAEEWDSLARACGCPLLRWGLLALLESSGSITPETGWTAAHLLIRRREAGIPRLVAAAPFYVKTHSWGEFVFDFEFAELAQRVGASYYPKLVGMVPATPAPAWRVMTAPGEDRILLTRLALDAATEAAREAKLGGLHILWPDRSVSEAVLQGPDSAPVRRGGRESVTDAWIRWDHQSFLWSDRGFGDFDGFLDSFSKNMRRNVRREREAVRSAGIETRMIEPGQADAATLERMAELYEAHNARFGPWAAKFLTRDFFLRLPEFMPEGWLLSAAFDGSSSLPFALAFLFAGPDRLYGRYWGSLREESGLHFELCYYLPIEYALQRGIASFDPGMGSPHKARRGFSSTLAPSLHRIFDRRLASVIGRFMPQINAEEAAQVEALDRDLPYKERKRP